MQNVQSPDSSPIQKPLRFVPSWASATCGVAPEALVGRTQACTVKSSEVSHMLFAVSSGTPSWGVGVARGSVEVQVAAAGVWAVLPGRAAGEPAGAELLLRVRGRGFCGSRTSATMVPGVAASVCHRWVPSRHRCR